MSDLIIRPYRPEDIPAVTRIYAHYVRETVITFELEGDHRLADVMGIDPGDRRNILGAVGADDEVGHRGVPGKRKGRDLS